MVADTPSCRPRVAYEVPVAIPQARRRKLAALEASKQHQQAAKVTQLKPKPKPRARRTSTTPESQVVEADLSRPIRPYSLSEHYDPGDRIQHPTLGLGVVQGAAGPQKIRVLFDERRSTLVHDRPAASASV